ncbi:MAG TPA: nicotinamide riboside transporter PnuC [Bacteroidales bacterium]|nr:nicotinamide riboside transporter PnuC [Bacteroidales bacterium]HRZ76079.1 nicotinamide riboside transporter PnuC [Bacteroidales bacterium]
MPTSAEMDFHGIWTLFLENLRQSTLLEAVAVFFGLLSVWYARKGNILVYPTGIVSVLIYVYICFNARIYADAGINAFYFGMSVYGWYFWTRKDSSRKVPPIRFSRRWEHLASLVAAVLFFFFLRFILMEYTDSNVPNWDALTTAIFIVGMWLMARKKVENWAWWIAGDLASIPLYFSKGLVLTSFQYTAFLVLAILGHIEWVRIARKGESE